MASTIAEERRSRKYYHSNEKYRKKKIEREVAKHKNNKPKYAKEQREYYKENKEYREYKKRYSREYKKREPIKSLPREKRKGTKKK